MSTWRIISGFTNLHSFVRSDMGCWVYELLPPVKKPAKTTGLKMGQGKFWADLRRGDSQCFSEPEEDCRSVVSGRGGATHRPPVTGVISLSLGLWSLRNRSVSIT